MRFNFLFSGFLLTWTETSQSYYPTILHQQYVVSLQGALSELLLIVLRNDPVRHILADNCTGGTEAIAKSFDKLWELVDIINLTPPKSTVPLKLKAFFGFRTLWSRVQKWILMNCTFAYRLEDKAIIYTTWHNATTQKCDWWRRLTSQKINRGIVYGRNFLFCS